MRATWAKRKTTCSQCKEDILVRDKRIDYTYRVKESKKFVTLRFHLNCASEFLGAWFEKNPYESTVKNPTGRPKLDLTENQKKKRRQLIASVSGFKSEFRERLTPIFEKKPNLEGLTKRELKTFVSYNKRLSLIKEKLLLVGGLPPSVSSLGGHDLDLILSKNPHLQLNTNT